MARQYEFGQELLYSLVVLRTFLPSRPATLNSQAYCNGTWVPTAELSILPDDLGFTMGISVVEKLRTTAGRLYQAERHLTRLRRSLEIVGFDAVRLSTEIESALHEFMQRNGTLINDGDDWSVSVFVTPGNLASAVKPTVCVHGHPIPFHNWATQFETGVEAVIVDVRLVPENCWPTELKCRSRMHYYLADRQAEARQTGARAILLDQDGYVGEGSTANVVAYFADRGFVTPRRSKVLPGVTQEVLYELADSLDIPHFEADMLPKEFAAADEIYFTSTSVCLLPVIRLEGKTVGSGEPGPVFHQLMKAWSDAVGIDIVQQALQFGSRRETASD